METRLVRNSPTTTARAGQAMTVVDLFAAALTVSENTAENLLLDQLVARLVANTTGAQRIRAGLPAGWRTGDKTGSGDRNEVDDVAITWPPGRPPVLLAVYTDPGDPTSPRIAPAVPAAAAVAVAALGLTG